MLQFIVDDEKCIRCGECARDCVSRIIVQQGDDLPFIPAEKEAGCVHCQHCLAICPTAAVSIFGKDPAESIALSADSFPTLAQMTRLVRGRRSVRRYRDENVDPVLLNQLLVTLANVPTGVNASELTFHVIDDKDVMRKFQHQVLDALREAACENGIPAGIAYLGKIAGMPFEQGVAILFRNAPHAIIVSAPADAPCPQEDVTLALAYFELLAQSAGLGTVWWGMGKMTLETLPELKPLLNLPAGHKYYAMLFGTPAISYPRTVQRDDAAVVRRVEL
ncbi:MAG: nitroreductase family protein [bacterium]